MKYSHWAELTIKKDQKGLRALFNDEDGEPLVPRTVNAINKQLKNTNLSPEMRGEFEKALKAKPDDIDDDMTFRKFHKNPDGSWTVQFNVKTDEEPDGTCSIDVQKMAYLIYSHNTHPSMRALYEDAVRKCAEGEYESEADAKEIVDGVNWCLSFAKKMLGDEHKDRYDFALEA